MNLAVLIAKAAVAVLLLVAGSAKLADPAGFATTVRLLAPPPLMPPRLASALARAVALAIAVAELVLGVASLSLPASRWLNVVVFAFTCGFVVTSAAGWKFHRGRSCRCFGALSSRTFDGWGLGRSAAIAAVAAVALAGPPARATALTTPDRALLVITGALVGLAAFTAARALGQARRLEADT